MYIYLFYVTDEIPSSNEMKPNISLPPPQPIKIEEIEEISSSASTVVQSIPTITTRGSILTITEFLFNHSHFFYYALIS